jgi:hypothetical protein
MGCAAIIMSCGRLVLLLSVQLAVGISLCCRDFLFPVAPVAAVKLLPLLSVSTHLISAYKIVAAALDDDVEMRM